MSTMILVWLIAGVVCVLLELIIPGGIIVFLGTSAMLVGGLLYFGLIGNLLHAFIAWFIISLILIIFVRSLFMKLMPGDTSLQNTDEDLECEGSIVEVVEEITPYSEGRIRFHETTWVAQSDSNIEVGAQALIVKRNGNKWIVKAL